MPTPPRPRFRSLPTDVAHVMQCMEVWGGNQTFDSSLGVAGLDLWVYSRPFGQSAAGGDVYYVSSCATGRITRLVVADVTGHGAAVGDLATGLRTLLRRYINFIDQGRFVRAMNGQFVTLSERGNFATAVAMTFFSPTRRLALSNAGHPPPLVYRVAQQRWMYLEHRRPADDLAPANLPLGILDLGDYDQFDTDLQVGDLVLSYTDSLPEAIDADGSMLGQAGLLRVVNAIPLDNPATFIARLLDTIKGLKAGNLEGDDVTALLFRPNGGAANTPVLEMLKAPFRILREVFRLRRRRDLPAPWPEPSLANLGGAILPPLSRSVKSSETASVDQSLTR